VHVNSCETAFSEYRIPAGLAVDQARAHLERRDRRDNEREARRPVMPVAREQPHAGGIAARHSRLAQLKEAGLRGVEARRGGGLGRDRSR